MAQEVLLRRNIEGVGEVGEIVKVKNGYARNYLLPHGYAALVTPDNMRGIEKDRKVEDVRQARLSAERAQIADRLADLKLTIEARAGEDGHLYGSVGPRHVLAAFQQQGFRFIERHIRFEAVRELGEYECMVILSETTQLPIKVWVVQDATEARAMADDEVRRGAEPEARDGGASIEMPAGDLLDAE